MSDSAGFIAKRPNRLPPSSAASAMSCTIGPAPLWMSLTPLMHGSGVEAGGERQQPALVDPRDVEALALTADVDAEPSTHGYAQRRARSRGP